MIVLAIIATIAGVLWSLIVIVANDMRSSPGDFEGGTMLAATWIGVAVMWLAWCFG